MWTPVLKQQRGRIDWRLVLAARPGLLPIPAGEPCFGRVRGGFGLDGSNHLRDSGFAQAESAKIHFGILGLRAG